MPRNIELAKRLRELFIDGYWIANTNYQSQLRNTNWEKAIEKRGSLNSIAALSFHVNYYLDGLNRAIDTGVLDIRDKFSYDMAPIENEADWQQLVDRLLSNAQGFVDRVEKFDDGTLEKPFIDVKYGSYARNIEGVLEHSYYHLGQIVLLRKLYQDV